MGAIMHPRSHPLPHVLSPFFFPNSVSQSPTDQETLLPDRVNLAAPTTSARAWPPCAVSASLFSTDAETIARHFLPRDLDTRHRCPETKRQYVHAAKASTSNRRTSAPRSSSEAFTSSTVRRDLFPLARKLAASLITSRRWYSAEADRKESTSSDTSPTFSAGGHAKKRVCFSNDAGRTG